jgi:hypothetical protein
MQQSRRYFKVTEMDIEVCKTLSLRDGQVREVYDLFIRDY